MEKDLTIEKECLAELFNGVVFEIMKYMKTKNMDMDDKNNILDQKIREAAFLADHVYSAKTEEEFNEYQKKYDDLWEYYNGLQ